MAVVTEEPAGGVMSQAVSNQARPTHSVDVVVLGAGFGGAALAAILARKGLSVLVLDAAAHPRFAIGESQTPELGFLLMLLAYRYGVPELEDIASFHRTRERVSSGCGVKRGFSFCHHTMNAEHRPEDTITWAALAPPLGPDTHFFRQDTDAFLAATAVRHGAELRTETRTRTIDISDERVALALDDGSQITCRFLVDASGPGSPLAAALQLRDPTPDARTHTRTLFNHFVDVAPYDQIVPYRRYGLPLPFHQTTLHHHFDGGFFWVIPFNNHAESPNPLCSVGVSLDTRRFPLDDRSPEAEWADLMRLFPSVGRQMASARPVRKWVKTGRLQYTSRRTVGARFCQLAHAAQFTDPLFSGGLTQTLRTVGTAAEAILASFADGRFDATRFHRHETQMLADTAYLDEIIANAHIAWRDHELWRAYFQCWSATAFAGGMGVASLIFKWRQTGDRRYLYMIDEVPYNGVYGHTYEPGRALIRHATETLLAVEAGRLDSATAAQALRDRYAASGIAPPHFEITARQSRSPRTTTLIPGLRFFWWTWTAADPAVKKAVYDIDFPTFVGATLEYAGERLKEGARQTFAAMRDIVRSPNGEWKARTVLASPPRSSETR